jgi:hypothetical protein
MRNEFISAFTEEVADKRREILHENKAGDQTADTTFACGRISATILHLLP